MIASTRLVIELLPQLELAQFTADADERERVREVRLLAQEQVRDDSTITNAYHRGRHDIRVYHMADGDNGSHEGLWRKWTPDQVALEAGMSPFLQRLTAAQREAIELVVVRGLSERGAAKVLSITQQAVHDRITKGVAQLRKALTAAFLTEDAEVAA